MEKGGVGDRQRRIGRAVLAVLAFSPYSLATAGVMRLSALKRK